MRVCVVIVLLALSQLAAALTNRCRCVTTSRRAAGKTAAALYRETAAAAVWTNTDRVLSEHTLLIVP